ncbi:ribonuclease H-like domain-containing protein [Phyllosticta capitalensis]|uniref:ribonuclease H-like domain-containing protein n=1 Tax=Phyllosticta capitalensis TaxID=121624 RepID=UPI0031317786
MSQTPPEFPPDFPPELIAQLTEPLFMVSFDELTSEADRDPLVIPDSECFGCSPVRGARAQQSMGGGSQGVWTATKFSPPAALEPFDVFGLRHFKYLTGLSERFVIRRQHVPALGSPRTIAIFTDGACSDNGAGVGGNISTNEPRGGFAFVYRGSERGTVGFALEKQGPTGDTYRATSNRAELRAAIAALKFRHWPGEGWDRLVLITDSQYVCRHATEWLRKWAARGWCTSSGAPVKNQDLWKELSDTMGVLAKGGCEVSFWAVPRTCNTTADRAAKEAATLEPSEEFVKIQSVVC